jgi:hypothetical protein
MVTNILRMVMDMPAERRSAVLQAAPAMALSQKGKGDSKGRNWGQEWVMHDLHEIETDLKATFKALPKCGR